MTGDATQGYSDPRFEPLRRLIKYNIPLVQDFRLPAPFLITCALAVVAAGVSPTAQPSTMIGPLKPADLSRRKTAANALLFDNRFVVPDALLRSIALRSAC